MGFVGAKTGANGAKYEATLRHVQPELLQVSGTKSYVCPRWAIG